MPHLTTLIARSPASLLSHIARISQSVPTHSKTTTLFALSSNIPSSADLSSLVSALNASFSFGGNGQTIGCLSSPLPRPASGSSEQRISCSLAIFDDSAIPFRSTIPGKEIPQVGRWHSFRDKPSSIPSSYTPQPGVQWSEIWDMSSNPAALPEELRDLQQKKIETLIYLSDLSPEGLSNTLASALPEATKLALLASSTPFITGRPVTLFHNSKIHSSGAVGIALPFSSGTTLTSTVQFIEAQVLSEPYTVTRCEGNMINSLSDSNPTKLLLSSIKASGMDMQLSGSFKEEEQFSLGVRGADGKISRIYRITAGDPSRGSISLDSERAPAEGTQVQFLHHPKSTSTTLPSYYLAPPSASTKFGFLSVREEEPSSDDTSTKVDNDDDDDTTVLENTFLAASENGFIFNGPPTRNEPEDAWRCPIPGGMGVLEWVPMSQES